MNTDNTQDAAEPSPASAGSVANPLEQIIRGTVRLHELIEQGRCDSEEADAVRDAMDAPFLELSESEREAASLVWAAIKDREWIPVAERLPCEYDRVIGWRSPWIRAAEVWRTTSGDWLFCDCEVAGEVTHWMPLPAPPSDGK